MTFVLFLTMKIFSPGCGSCYRKCRFGPGKCKTMHHQPIRSHKMSILVIVSENGDDRLFWSPHDQLSVEKVKAVFDDLIGKGYLGARMLSAGEGEAIKSFDPLAREIVMSPAVVAG